MAERPPGYIERRGRKTILTPALMKFIVDALKVGSTVKMAAEAAGVGERTYYTWMEKGEAATSGIYKQFRQEVEKAQASCSVRDLGRIEKAARDGVWQAAAWRLERRHPNDFGRRSPDVVVQNVTNEVTVHAVEVTAIIANLEAMGVELPPDVRAQLEAKAAQ